MIRSYHRKKPLPEKGTPEYAARYKPGVPRPSKPKPRFNGLTCRAANVIEAVGWSAAAHYDNPASVAGLTASQLLADYRCGKKTLAEIQAWLAGYGMSLRD